MTRRWRLVKRPATRWEAIALAAGWYMIAVSAIILICLEPSFLKVLLGFGLIILGCFRAAYVEAYGIFDGFPPHLWCWAFGRPFPPIPVARAMSVVKPISLERQD